MSPRPPNSLIGIFAQHRVACNLLMLLMLLAGSWGLMKLNTQFFPDFAIDFIVVNVAWSGASAEDMEAAIVKPLEDELRTLDNLKQITSTASEGIASVLLEYREGIDIAGALDDVKNRVSLIRNLPGGAEEPTIQRIVNYEPIAHLLVSGSDSLAELRTVVRQIERELLDRGIAKIRITGLPEEEIAIQISTTTLQELGLSLPQIAARISQNSRDLPAGTVGRDEIALQLRSLNQRRNELAFEDLPLLSGEQGQRVTLADVATIERRARARQVRVIADQRPAVELTLLRAETADSLESAAILEQWLQQQRPQLPQHIVVQAFDQSFQLIIDRITLLLKNGFGGLILVVAILFVFMNGRVAFWVAVGIPVSFMAAIGALYILGGSINMISLFAMIMTLGIIVDDAIVVGEDALTQYQSGSDPLVAAESGAQRMFIPVMSSSLTTIAAFLPLMLIGGIIGNILFDIPLVVICVIIASLIESFFVLPGHLRRALVSIHAAKQNPLRQALDRGFNRIRDGFFRITLHWCVNNPWIIVCVALSLFALSIGLVAGGRVPFVFFPTPEGTQIYANISFVAGTPPQRVETYLQSVANSLDDVEAESNEKLIEIAIQKIGSLHFEDGRTTPQAGDQYASLVVELTNADDRKTRIPQIIQAWKSRLQPVAGLENLTIRERRAGPPGSDVDIRLIGDNPSLLKQAALDLTNALAAVDGVTGSSDNMPFGQQQLIYELTPQGRALGLTVEEVSRQLRAAYDGHIAQIFQDGSDEVEVRVVLPDRERYSLGSLERMTIALPDGNRIALMSAVKLHTRRGFEILRHTNGRLSLQVSADIDPSVTSSDKVIEALTGQNAARNSGEDSASQRIRLTKWLRAQLEPAATNDDQAANDTDNFATQALTALLRWLLERLPEAKDTAPILTQSLPEADAAQPPSLLSQLRDRYDIEYAFEGRRQDQSQTLTDMRNGGILALAMIYLVLAWVFASYSWPLIVMSAIPLGLIGAISGHWIMGIDLTILSLFGVFGLSGIVVNDSIILIVFYKQLIEKSGLDYRAAIVEAGCRRLRAVLLTSLTTIAGLTPLLFETSLQAQFLIPMAVSISYGLAFATLLVLLLIPSLLSIYECTRHALKHRFAPKVTATA